MSINKFLKLNMLYYLRYIKDIIFLCFCLSVITNHVSADNPEDYVSKHILSNGLKVFLAAKPDLNTVSVTMVVEAGYLAEIEDNISVAHLLEHMLFRSSKLDGDLTYLSLFKDDSSEINGRTDYRDTTYYADHKSERLDWVLEQFSQMLFDRQTDLANQTFLEKEKQTVRLERGELSWAANLFGVDLVGKFSHLFKRKDFRVSEFGIDYSYFSRDQELLTLKKLTADQIVYFYDKYYYPQNMTLIVAGGFELSSTLAKVEKLFGQFKNPDKQHKLEDLVPQVKAKPYLRYEYSAPNNSIFYGLKYENINQKEEVVLDTYFVDLKDRLMKSIRDESGETYTVQNSNAAYGSVNLTGYKSVSFGTPFEQLDKYTQHVKTKLQEEMANKALTDEQIQVAIDKRLNKYLLNDITTRLLGRAARNTAYYDQYFEQPYKPNTWLGEITADEFRTILNRLYDEKLTLKSLRSTHWRFKYDTEIFGLLALLLAFMLTYKLLKQDYDITRANKIINLTHSPWMLLEVILMISITAVIISLLNVQILGSFMESEFEYKFGYLPQLALSLISAIIYFFLLFFAVRIFIKRIFLKDSGLTLNHLGLKTDRIDYSQISRVSAQSLFSILVSVNLLGKIKWRFYGNWFCFWRKLIFLELNNGKAYAFAAKNAQANVELISTNLQLA